mgnify:FL=1|jgi:excinuclease UvrABC ATPase subunit
MKQKIFLAAFLSLSVLFMAFSSSPKEDAKKNKYLGANTCAKMCHKTEKQGEQLKIWQESDHSKAYKTLLKPESDEISKKLGKGDKASESEFCLKCHVTGYGSDPTLFDEKYSKEDGVQCESCHGAGSEYKTMKIMKDRQEAIKNGLKYHENKEEYCVGCHNSESPTYKEFKFEEKWAKIKHYVPKEK